MVMMMMKMTVVVMMPIFINKENDAQTGLPLDN